MGYPRWEQFAPFVKIIVTAAVDHIPVPLIEQLKDEGRLIMPVGDTTEIQSLTLGENIVGEVENLNRQRHTLCALYWQAGRTGQLRGRPTYSQLAESLKSVVVY